MIQERIYYPGYDILKFILATLIVAVHCSFLKDFNDSVYAICNVIEGFAIPTFFAVSSYLFFCKIDEPNALKKIVKRIAIIFSIWYIFMFPMTYVKFFSLANYKEIIYAIVLSCTFNGYWFFKALMINTIILYIAHKGGKTIFYITFVVSLIIYLFGAYNYVHHFVNLNISPYYSFFYNIAYVFIGALFYKFNHLFSRALNDKFILISLIALLVIGSLNENIFVVSRLIMPLLLLLLFKDLTTQKSNICKRLRAMSILFYVMQFVLIWIYDSICNKILSYNYNAFAFFNNSIIRFTIVLLILYILSSLFLKFEKRYKYLSYLH